MQERHIGSLGWEGSLKKEREAHSRNGNPHSMGLGNPMDRGAWRATVHGVTKRGT